MDQPPAWDHVGDEALLDCRVFSVRRARARSPITGAEHDFYSIDAPDWVNVIPVTEDRQVVLVRQYRHGTRGVTLEIPGGMIDPGETPEQAAARELLEETGYAADELVSLGSVHPNPALFGNLCHTFLATGARQVGEVENEGTEDTRLATYWLDDIPELVRSGDITHALVIAAFHWHGLHGGG